MEALLARVGIVASSSPFSATLGGESTVCEDAPLEFVDCRTRVRESEVLSLLSEAVGNCTDSKLDAIASSYESEPGRFLLGLARGASILGLIGGEIRRSTSASILYIVVRREHRRNGLGRSLIERPRDRFSLREIVAETDREALAFYERCGFSVASLGERYPGVERFSCRWAAA